MIKLITLCFVLLASSLSAATYYIDYAGGDDTHAGTAIGTAWKRHPYQSTFTGSYTHAAGDRFVFKGGVTWPAAAGRIVMAAGGSAGAGNDYYGIDQTWYTGSSWTHPVFDAEYVNNGCIGIQSNSYVTIEGLEGKRAMLPADNYAIFGLDSGHHILIKDCYVHGWRTSAGTDGNRGGIIVGSFNTQSDTIIVDHCEIENSENNAGVGGNGPNGQCVSRVGIIRNGSKIHDNSSLCVFVLDFGGATVGVYGPCELYNAWGVPFDGAYHTNGIYLDAQTFGPTWTAAYIRNSKLHDVYAGANLAYPNPRGATLWIYNNVMYGHMTDQCAINIDDGAYGTETAGSVVIFNNTIANFDVSKMAINLGDRTMAVTDTPNTAFHYRYPGGHYRIKAIGTTNFVALGAASNTVGLEFTSNSTVPTGTGEVRSYVQDLKIFNNHIINAATVTNAGSDVYVTYENGTNLSQSAAGAAADSYTLGNLYSPTLAGSPTVGTGTTDTVTGSLADIANVPWAGAWGIGAYKFVSGGGGDTTAPTPNPATISGTPTHTATSITVTASTATDAGSPPVSYQFSSDAGSSWTVAQSSATYTFTSLAPSTLYHVQVRALDASLNVTTASSITDVTTDALPAAGSTARLRRGAAGF